MGGSVIFPGFGVGASADLIRKMGGGGLLGSRCIARCLSTPSTPMLLFHYRDLYSYGTRGMAPEFFFEDRDTTGRVRRVLTHPIVPRSLCPVQPFSISPGRPNAVFQRKTYPSIIELLERAASPPIVQLHFGISQGTRDIPYGVATHSACLQG